MIKRNALLLAVVLVLFAGSTMAGTLSGSGMEDGRKTNIKHPLGGSSTITQNLDPALIEAGGGIACNGTFGTTDTGNWRAYDLDADHGLSGEVCVKNVAYGMESVSSDQVVTLSVGCSSQSNPYGDAFIDLGANTEVGTATELIPGDGTANLAPFDTDVGGCCDAGEFLVVGIISPDCDAAGDPNCPANSGQMFMGGNTQGQTRPTYISAEDCGITNPFDLALLGFPGAHHLQVVTINTEGGGDDGGGSPAATTFGMLLMVLILIGTSAYFMRRQVNA